MNSAIFEGTVISIKPNQKQPQEENIDEIKPTANPLSKEKAEFPQHQSPQDDNRQGKKVSGRIAQLWAELTNLKKVLIVGGIILFLMLLALIVLIIVAMSYKPTVTFRPAGSLRTPTGEKVQSYEGQASKKSILGPNKNANLTLNTVTDTTKVKQRGLQEGQSTEAKIATIEFDYSNQGVSIIATSGEDFIIHVDYDKMIQSYSDKRLLLQVEMLAALRLMQQTQSGTLSSPPENSFAFDDSTTILRDAEASLLQSVAAATDSAPSDLTLEYSETVTILQQSDGSYVPDPSLQSSRLLHALSALRGLQEWENIFNDINNAVLKPKIEEAKETLSTFFSNPENIENAEVREALQSSNFGSSVDVDVSYEENPSAVKRLLQNDSPASSADEKRAEAPTTTPNASSEVIPTQTNITNSTNSTAPAKQKNCRAVSPRWRSRRGKAGKSKCFSESAFNATTKCTGRFKRKQCRVGEVNSTGSPYRWKKGVNQSQLNNLPKRGRHSVAFNFRKGSRRNTTNQNNTNNATNNLKVEPEKKNETPKADPKPEPTKTPTTPSASETPTTPTPTPSSASQSTPASTSTPPKPADASQAIVATP